MNKQKNSKKTTIHESCFLTNLNDSTAYTLPGNIYIKTVVHSTDIQYRACLYKIFHCECSIQYSFNLKSETRRKKLTVHTNLFNMYRLKILAKKNKFYYLISHPTFFHWMSDEQEIILVCPK